MKYLKAEYIFLSILIFASCEESIKPPDDSEFVNEAKTYLTDNEYIFDLESADPLGGLPDSIFSNGYFVITGENHGIKENSNIQYLFLEYLNDKFGTNVLILEIGYSISLQLNDFLATGNKNILDHIFSYTKGTYFWTKENYSFFEKIYDLNLMLQQERKIKFIGIDVEHQYILAFESLNELVSGRETPEIFRKFVEDIQSIIDNNIYDRARAEKLAADYLFEINQSEEIAEGFFQENLIDAEIILSGIGKLFEWSNSSIGFNQRDDNIREEFMCNNFIKLSNRDQNGRYYGHFGNSHIMLSETENVNWFAARLKMIPEYNNRVISIYSIYSDTYSLSLNNDGTYGQKSTGPARPPFDFITETAENKITFYTLNNSGSPFSNSKYLEYYSELSGFSFVVTDYFQNLLVIKNGTASSPLH